MLIEFITSNIFLVFALLIELIILITVNILSIKKSKKIFYVTLIAIIFEIMLITYFAFKIASLKV